MQIVEYGLVAAAASSQPLIRQQRVTILIFQFQQSTAGGNQPHAVIRMLYPEGGTFRNQFDAVGSGPGGEFVQITTMIFRRR